MDINYNDLLKEQALFIAPPIILLILFLGGTGYFGYSAYQSGSQHFSNNKKIEGLKATKADLEAKLEQQKIDDANPENKKILELEGVKFGADASFAPLFENMLTVAKASGIRFRSVEYNYAPAEDPIFASNTPGFNVCEVDATVVGEYSQLQAFLKTMLSENYLINIASVEIVSWQRDKRILITNVKLRFYTKTA